MSDKKTFGALPATCYWWNGRGSGCWATVCDRQQRVTRSLTRFLRPDEHHVHPVLPCFPADAD